ncbi:hypothetical protein GCM10027174_35930 [Salinifilum aidingensis]
MTAPTRNNRTGQKRSQSARSTTEDTAPREERRSRANAGQRTSRRGGRSAPSGKGRGAKSAERTAQGTKSAGRTGRGAKSRQAVKGTPQGAQRSARSQRAAPQSSPAVLRLRSAVDRIPLVGVVMTLLGVGLAATLWLSIAAVSGSYHLQQGQAELNSLSERKEELVREVNTLNSSPMIQRRAEQQGMVPGPMPAHLVQRPDGSAQVIGEPEQAQAPAPPPPPREPAGQRGEQSGRGGGPQSDQDGGRPAQDAPDQAAGPAGDGRGADGGNARGAARSASGAQETPGTRSAGAP